MRKYRHLELPKNNPRSLVAALCRDDSALGKGTGVSVSCEVVGESSASRKFRRGHSALRCQLFVLICAQDMPIRPILPILPIEKSITYLFSILPFVVPFQNSLHERFFPQAVKPCAGTSEFVKHTLTRTPGATPGPRSVRFQRWVVRKRTGFQICSPVDIQQNQCVLLDVYMAENVLTPYAGRTFLRARRSTSLGRRRAYEETLAGTLSCDCSL